MKKLLLIFSAAVLGLSACKGPAGPVGPQGPQGPKGNDGGSVYAQAIELIVDFTPANDFRLFAEPFGFEVYPADVPLVYIRWEVDNGTEVWRPLPQTAYLNAGLLTYNFDFTQQDFSLFLDGTVPDFSKLPTEYLNNQVFRVVVVPAEFLKGGRLSSRSYENITETFGIKDSDFIKRDLR